MLFFKFFLIDEKITHFVSTLSHFSLFGFNKKIISFSALS